MKSPPVYCFMPDHLHAIATGTSKTTDLARFASMAKQRAGWQFRMATGERLWQKGYYDRVLREDGHPSRVMAHIVNNPVRAGLASCPEEYPFWGSSAHTREEILDMVGDVPDRTLRQSRARPRTR